MLGKLADRAFSRQEKNEKFSRQFIIIGHKSLIGPEISSSVVIDSYQVPRAAEAWPWPSRHGPMRLNTVRLRIDVRYTS